MGGTPCDAWFKLIATEEIARAGSAGLMASLFSHNIGLPPINAPGSDELKCSDIAHLRFDNCRVPIENLIGEENQGYREVKIMMIGGGTEEIMNELAARQLGV